MTQFFLFLGQEWQLVSALLALVGLYFWSENRRSGQSISVHQLTAQVNQDKAVIVDLRDPKEFREGHIVEAVNLPFAKLQERMVELQPYRERPLVLVDKMGQHSGTAGRLLQQAGYRVSRLNGGMSEWLGSNLPVVKGN